jgi:Ca2+/Na+ antiporter
MMPVITWKERKGIWAFLLASATTPFALLIPASCGAACGVCPVPGGCFVLPAIVVGIVALISRFQAVRYRILALFRQ